MIYFKNAHGWFGSKFLHFQLLSRMKRDFYSTFLWYELKLACNITVTFKRSNCQFMRLLKRSLCSALLNIWIQTSTTFIQQPTEYCSKHWMELFSTILAVNFVLLCCQFEHSLWTEMFLVAKAFLQKWYYEVKCCLMQCTTSRPQHRCTVHWY